MCTLVCDFNYKLNNALIAYPKFALWQTKNQLHELLIQLMKKYSCRVMFILRRSENISLPTKAKMTVKNDATGKVTFMLNSSICSKSTGKVFFLKKKKK